MAYSWGIPLLAVNSLDSLAQLGRGYNHLICPLIRFRRNEYYFSFYTHEGNDIQRQSNYDVKPLEKIVEELDESIMFCGLLHPNDQHFFPFEGKNVFL